MSVLTNPRASPGRVPQSVCPSAHAENNVSTRSHHSIRRKNCFASCQSVPTACHPVHHHPSAVLAGNVWICLQQRIFVHPEASSDEQVGQHQHGTFEPVAATILGWVAAAYKGKQGQRSSRVHPSAYSNLPASMEACRQHPPALQRPTH